jgi:outer membrane protein TolC
MVRRNVLPPAFLLGLLALLTGGRPAPGRSPDGTQVVPLPKLQAAPVQAAGPESGRRCGVRLVGAVMKADGATEIQPVSWRVPDPTPNPAPEQGPALPPASSAPSPGTVAGRQPEPVRFAAAPPPRPDEPGEKLPAPKKSSESTKADERPTPPGPASLERGDRPLPINLATALRLADARPLIIEAARAAVETEYGLYEQARVLWLPNLDAGFEYQRHDGGQLNFLTAGQVVGPRSQFFAGAGARAVFALTDAIYAPLAELQLLRARGLEVQTAKNDALLSVAEAYFSVQQARGVLAGTQDCVARARELVRRVRALGKGLAAPIEAERVDTLLADLGQQAASFRQDWRTSSADLTRVLRLAPAAVVTPLEPPHLRVPIISPKEAVDDLVPVGLTNRPELASQQAVVQAALVRLRQERMRPLIPSLVLTSNSTPTELLGVGIYGAGRNGPNHWAARSDWDAAVVWEVKNLGFGNRGLVTQRQGEQRQALVELFRIQDQVAAEVVQAHAQVEAAAVRVERAEEGLKSALASYDGNLKGLGQTVRVGELLQLVNRPQEVVAALQQLQQAYVNYFASVNDYNRAQFRLYRALGYPAHGLACGASFGPVVPVNASRPPQMAPVNAPEPCQDCPR